MEKIKIKRKPYIVTNRISNSHKGNPIKPSAIFFSRNFAGQEGVARIYLKCPKGKSSKREYATWQGYHSELKEG